MKRPNFTYLIARGAVLVLLFTVLATLSMAQDEPDQRQRPRQFVPQRPGAQPNLFRELGLSQEQIVQFRRLNAAARPRREQAQRRLREANRALDAAIYADAINDQEFETRLKAFQDAQTEVTRLKFTDELAIRNILSPEQLVKFRELRRRAAESLVDGPQRRALRRTVPRRDSGSSNDNPTLD